MRAMVTSSLSTLGEAMMCALERRVPLAERAGGREWEEEEEDCEEERATAM